MFRVTLEALCEHSLSRVQETTFIASPMAISNGLVVTSLPLPLSLAVIDGLLDHSSTVGQTAQAKRHRETVKS